VNADDLGRSPGVNQGIAEAHRKGIVTSATLLVNAPAAEDAADVARQNPGLGIGLHLAFTGLRSTLGLRAIPSLLTAEGLLPPKPEALARVKPEHVLLEARAQLARFRDILGRLPTHFDTHHHAHRLPVVLEAVMVLSWETGLPVRSASAEVQAQLRREGRPTTDRFREDFFGPGATVEGLCSIIDHLEAGTTELMCHPAVVDDALRHGSSYAEPRAAELKALCSVEARHALQASGVKLVDYSALSQ
jgi:predicted glycoside hydrolase/deacetylase ChbG (UPF0249 family)